MKFINNLLQAMGFSQQVEEDVDYNDELHPDKPNRRTGSNAIQPADKGKQSNPFQSQKGKQRTPVPQAVSEEELNDLTVQVFDGVIGVFNEALPQFLRDSVDPEAQRKLLYDNLDSSIKAHFARLNESARKSTEAQWAAEKEALKNEVDAAKAKCKIAESKQTEYQQEKLSAERQKRALSDRVKDLETKIMNLEADKEQLDLQTKSLLNRIKASEVRGGDVQALNDQITDLQNQLNESRKANIAARNGAPVDNKELEALRKQIADNAAEKEAADAEIKRLNDEIAAQKEELAARENEIDRLNNIDPGEEVKQVREKNRIADALINDLNSKMAQAKKDIAEKDRIIERLTSEGKREKAEAEIARERLRISGDNKQTVALQSKKISEQAKMIDDLTRKVKTLTERVANQDKDLELVNKVQEQIEKFDKIKANADAQIKSLKAERDQLKQTIETNLYNQANTEKRLRQQIDDLEAKLKSSEQKPKPKKEASKLPPMKISAIDSEFDDTDWLVGTPDPNASIINPEDDDFGYQEPERKEHNPDDPQLPLFDI